MSEAAAQLRKLQQQAQIREAREELRYNRQRLRELESEMRLAVKATKRHAYDETGDALLAEYDRLTIETNILRGQLQIVGFFQMLKVIGLVVTVGIVAIFIILPLYFMWFEL